VGMSGWTAEKIRKLFEEYNDYILNILHEKLFLGITRSGIAINRQVLLNILGNGAMIEGWAVYAELMMLKRIQKLR
jgi:hypothetical protein